jgi:PAS domain S-box-containing protein
MVFIIFVSFVIMGYFQVSSVYGYFREESEKLRRDYLESQKSLIKNETQMVIESIEYRRSKTDEELKQIIKQRVYEAHAVASHIYNQYRTSKTEAEIKRLIKEALRPIRFNAGRGFYFIYTLAGVEILNPLSPATEGTSRLNLQDKNGVFVIKKEIDIVKRQGEGFSLNYWRDPETNEVMIYSKASFVKHFEPYNWYIGTKEYREDFIDAVQKEVLEQASRIRIRKEGYIFIITLDGLVLLNEASKQLIGKNISQGHGENAANVVHRGRALAMQPGGGFMHYEWDKPSTQELTPKISFVMGVLAWGGFVGTGVYLDEIDNIIAEKRTALEENVRFQVGEIVIIFLGVFILVLLLTLFFSRKLQKQLDVFISFFKNVASRNEKIDKSPLFAREFRELADSANVMLSRRQKVEKALQESEERMAVTFRSIAEGVITTDTEGKIRLLNRVAEQLTGWKQEEAVGKPLTEVFRVINVKTREPIENPVDMAMTGREVGLTSDIILVARDGTERIVYESAAPILDGESNVIGVVMVFQDITQRQHMEQEAQRAQKLESLGLLAGGIAHDFNNLLSTILGNINLVRMYTDTDGDEKILKTLLRTEKAVSRAKNLTQQLLTFARGGDPIRKTHSIAKLVKESTSLSLRGSNVKCDTQLPADLWTVEVDEGQLIQVFNNLLINARQAMPEGGTIKLTAENITLDRSFDRLTKKGDYVKISVEDHGTGMPGEHLQKVFDPYFTTKENGSGLGLASSYSIVLKHEGYITVDSEVGQGTTFCVYLPASVGKADQIEGPQERPVPGKGRILVMDDEEMLLVMVEDMLAFLGYEAEGVCDGDEAIAFYTRAMKTGESFDAVVMDLTIPGGMGGEETIKRLLKIDPCIKAIVSSGYSNSPLMSNYKSYGFKERIVKPYTIEELSRALHAVLEGEDPRDCGGTGV